MSYDPDQYLEERRSTWSRFIKLTFWTTGAIFATLALMAIFLT